MSIENAIINDKEFPNVLLERGFSKHKGILILSSHFLQFESFLHVKETFIYIHV